MYIFKTTKTILTFIKATNYSAGRSQTCHIYMSQKFSALRPLFKKALTVSPFAIWVLNIIITPIVFDSCEISFHYLGDRPTLRFPVRDLHSPLENLSVPTAGCRFFGKWFTVDNYYIYRHALEPKIIISHLRINQKTRFVQNYTRMTKTNLFCFKEGKSKDKKTFQNSIEVSLLFERKGNNIIRTE